MAYEITKLYMNSDGITENTRTITAVFQFANIEHHSRRFSSILVKKSAEKNEFHIFPSERYQFATDQMGGYKTKTEDLRPKNEDPVKIVLKSLIKGSNMILDGSRNKEHQDLQLSTIVTRVFVLYITLPKVQNEDPFKIVLKLLENGSKQYSLLDR